MSKISREALLEMARGAMDRSVVAMRENAIAEATTPPSKLKSAAQQFDKTECFLEHFAELVLAAREQQQQQTEPVAQDWQTELLDWVSACQSAYYIDSTEGHRFGGTGSNLEENRAGIVTFVTELLLAAQHPVECVPASAYRDAANAIEWIRGASQHCECHAFEIANGWINETNGGTVFDDPSQPPAVKESLTAQAVIPAGYALVPVEPTEEMINGSRAALHLEGMTLSARLLQNTHRVMLANAPQPPLVSADELVAAEREACAKLCDEESGEWWFADNGNQAAKDCAAAIRARGEK